jgi:hypothetical protein
MAILLTDSARLGPGRACPCAPRRWNPDRNWQDSRPCRLSFLRPDDRTDLGNSGHTGLLKATRLCVAPVSFSRRSGSHPSPPRPMPRFQLSHACARLDGRLYGGVWGITRDQRCSVERKRENSTFVANPETDPPPDLATSTAVAELPGPAASETPPRGLPRSASCCRPP